MLIDNKLCDLLNHVKKILQESNVQEAHTEAELIAAHVLNVSRGEIPVLKALEKSVSAKDEALLFEIVQSRCKTRKPLAYILQKAFFRNIELYVDERVLIPRAETEILIDFCNTFIRKHSITCGVDVGCGSGAIALSLLQENQSLKMIGTDISLHAATVACHNAKKLSLNTRFMPVVCNLINACTNFEFVVANLPYVPIECAVELQTELTFEPSNALFAVDNGFFYIEALLRQILQTAATRFIALETYGESHIARIMEIAKNSSYFCFAEKDYFGTERFAILERK